MNIVPKLHDSEGISSGVATRDQLIEALSDVTQPGEKTEQDQLAEYVPFEAIERLDAHENGSWTLSFDLPGATVTVDGDGTTTVHGQPQSAPETTGTVLGTCPTCGAEFRREFDSGQRVGYEVLGKGSELALVRCLPCGDEIVVPETGYTPGRNSRPRWQ